MALTVADFKARFPELSEAPDDLIEAKLAQALRSIDTNVWGDLSDDGQGQYAAHLLALGPYGAAAGFRLGGGANQRTIYQTDFEEMQRRVGIAHRLVLE